MTYVRGPLEGTCAELGPWETYCTDYPGHRYSHYDASDDSSWQDDWREYTPVEGGGNYRDPTLSEEIDSWFGKDIQKFDDLELTLVELRQAKTTIERIEAKIVQEVGRRKRIV